jgi:hypothetical protein
MSRREAERKLAGANPVDPERVAGLPPTAGEEEMLAAIVAEPRERRGQAPREPRMRRRYAVAVATACAAIAVVALFALGGGRPNDPGRSAYGADLVRFAENSPLILLEEQGWRVANVIAASPREGEIDFVRGGRTAGLYWRQGPLRTWIVDRAREAREEKPASVLGTSARVFRYPCCGPGQLDFTALWQSEGRVLEFRSQEPSLRAFERRLAALAKVEATTWLDALPPRVLRAVDRPEAIAGMLRGLPLPPGITAADVRGPALTTDRHAVAVQVLGTVACAWRARWRAARRAGDGAAEREAVEAMAGAKDWPLTRMVSERSPFGFGGVVVYSARAMPSGRWALQCGVFR